MMRNIPGLATIARLWRAAKPTRKQFDLEAARTGMDKTLTTLGDTAWYLAPYLKPDRIKPGERSLHIGSGLSFVPFAEAALGLEVVATECPAELDGLFRVKRAFSQAATPEGLDLSRAKIVGLDLLGGLTEFPPNHFDHINIQNVLNFLPFIQRVYARYGIQNFDQYEIIKIVLIIKILSRLKTGGTITSGDDWGETHLYLGELSFYLSNKDPEYRLHHLEHPAIAEALQETGLSHLQATMISEEGEIETPTEVDPFIWSGGAIFRIQKN
ncbi:MAG: hypothetical protein ABIE84_01770 [bacterium]